MTICALYKSCCTYATKVLRQFIQGLIPIAAMRPRRNCPLTQKPVMIGWSLLYHLIVRLCSPNLMECDLYVTANRMLATLNWTSRCSYPRKIARFTLPSLLSLSKCHVPFCIRSVSHWSKVTTAKSSSAICSSADQWNQTRHERAYLVWLTEIVQRR